LFVVIVTIDALPHAVDEFSAIIAENARLSVEREPGCLVFDVSRAADLPNRFYLYEVYDDEAAFVFEHKGSAHFADFVVRSTPLVVPGSKREVHAHRTIAAQKENNHELAG